MTGFFLAIFRLFRRYPLLPAILFVVWISTGIFFASRIELREDISDMLPGDKQSSGLTEYFKNSTLTDRIIVSVSGADGNKSQEELIEQADILVQLLRDSCSEFIDTLQYKNDEESFRHLIEIVGSNLPLFLTSQDYQRIDSVLTDEGIRNQVESGYRNLVSPSGFTLRNNILGDPLGIGNPVYERLRQFGSGSDIELYDDYYFSKDGANLLVFINPEYPSGNTEKNILFSAKLRHISQSAQFADNGIKIHYFGAPLVAAGNSERIRKDTTITLSITVIALLVVFLLFFRNLKSPVVVLIPVVLGGLFSLTLIYFIKGSLSLISLGAGSLILGIAVNYSLHFLTHLRFHPDPQAAIREITFPMIAGSLTTILGFLCLQFIDTPVLRDLGLHAAFSLMGAALATLLFLPHLGNVKNKSADKPIAAAMRGFIELPAKLSRNKYLFAGIFLLTPVMLWFARDVSFETDMYKINYMSEDLRENETYINRFTSRFQKSVVLVSGGADLETALVHSENLLDKQKDLLDSGVVLGYTNVSSIFPSAAEQAERINRWNEFWKGRDAEAVYAKVEEAGKEFKFKPGVFQPFRKLLTNSYQPLDEEKTQVLLNSLGGTFISKDANGISLTSLIVTKPENAPIVYKAFEAENGVHIFDRKYLTDRLVEMVGDDFSFITFWTSLIVFVSLLIIYGRIELAVISFMPMAISWIWILGIMSVFGITFNIINIVLSTLIFALGDDFCIFTADSLQQEYAHGNDRMKTTSTSVSLSAITTLIGTGVLVFAEHPSLKSIAAVAIIGIGSVWFMSQVVQPVLFRFLITNPTRKKHQPYTFSGILKSIFSFSYFTIGSLVITVTGIVMLKLIPGAGAGRKLIYHRMMAWFNWSLVYIMGNVKKKIINETGEDFSKPAIIIANHSSVLDILLTVMLHPKIILITNKWVWNSPVFGTAIRMAEYFSITEGTEENIDRLEEKMKDGYSIVIFPEGTRSVDGSIGRFHKGAFLLAEKLKADILPLLIHGAGPTLTKGFFYLKDGSLTLKFLPRIPYSELPLYGETYRERTKNISREFKKQFSEFSKERGNTNYFKNILFTNYIYKGPVLEWYMKVKLRLENNYRIFDDLAPKKGRIIDLGCGYGFLPYMLSLTSRERTITGCDYDEEKISIAQNGYLRGDNLSFIAEDITRYDFHDADAVIINDVLHYLTPEEQTSLLDKCVQALNPGGKLIIRDGIRELEERHQGTRITELFSTKILRFNKTTEQGLNFISRKLIDNLAERHQLAVETIDITKYTSNLIFVIQKK